MRQQEQRLSELGVEVAVVTFDADYMAKSYVQQTQLQWPLLVDADRDLYRAYGMERADLWSIYGPASVWNYLKLLFQGRRLHRPGSDTRQLGGDVLIDPQGIVQFHYVSTSPHDRPTPETILSICQSNGAACAGRSNV